METLQQCIRIARLICKEKLMALTDREERELRQWRESGVQNRQDYESLHIIQPDSFISQYEQIQPEKKWADFQRRLNRSRFSVSVRLAGVAASVCLLLGLSFFFFLQSSTEPHQMVRFSDREERGVHLILSNGELLNLSSLKREMLQKIEGRAIVNDEKLEYRKDTVEQLLSEQNTLLIPKGAFYHLILADGTRIWLNADTKITYPVQFTGDRREITLSGEAYLNVAKDPQRPFIVHTDNFNISVLGTSFNVNTYGDGGKVYAALQEGVVEISESQGNALILAPGQVAELDICRPGSLLKISDQTLTQQIAWKEGYFCFRHTSLADIFRQVERYYDVHFVNTEFVADEYYTGDISRNVPLSALLSVIHAQTSGVEFETLDKIVYIIKKRD